jgi:hypothetical protein
VIGFLDNTKKLPKLPDLVTQIKTAIMSKYNSDNQNVPLAIDVLFFDQYFAIFSEFEILNFNPLLALDTCIANLLICFILFQR